MISFYTFRNTAKKIEDSLDLFLGNDSFMKNKLVAREHIGVEFWTMYMR